ncbi:hypothetical protein MuYL_4397 [Mucilaginibacter xinganensis]|uniref:Uncharacterized protein n=1 Tax=Mucilaginibacter xinganensis TaxID=1234841 RepID=A0A223P2F4_9SPHI|nr:hypothetical protein MuYL_4397 [Mucilaginibacter xinganensis]
MLQHVKKKPTDLTIKVFFKILEAEDLFNISHRFRNLKQIGDKVYFPIGTMAAFFCF